MEGLVLAVLQQQLRLFDVIPSNIDSIECSETECSIRFESADNDSFEDYDDNQRLVLEAFREAPISAIQYSWSGGVVAGVGYFRGITIRSFTRERQRPAPGQFFISAADILGAAASQLPVDDFDAPPARIRMFNLNGNFGFVMAENICAYDCASDGRQVIYLDFPDTATCAEMQGIEQAFMARTSNGGIDERTFCVPNTLVND
jgi:hypothetical protein